MFYFEFGMRACTKNTKTTKDSEYVLITRPETGTEKCFNEVILNSTLPRDRQLFIAIASSNGNNGSSDGPCAELVDMSWLADPVKSTRVYRARSVRGRREGAFSANGLVKFSLWLPISSHPLLESPTCAQTTLPF